MISNNITDYSQMDFPCKFFERWSWFTSVFFTFSHERVFGNDIPFLRRIFDLLFEKQLDVIPIIFAHKNKYVFIVS